MTRSRYSWLRVWHDLRGGYWKLVLDFGLPLVELRWWWWDAQLLIVRIYPVRLLVGWTAAPRFDDDWDEEPPA